MPVDLDAPPVKVTVGDDVAVDEPPSTVPLGCSAVVDDVTLLFSPAFVSTVAVVVSPVSLTLSVAEGLEEDFTASGTPSRGAEDAAPAATVWVGLDALSEQSVIMVFVTTEYSVITIWVVPPGHFTQLVVTVFKVVSVSAATNVVLDECPADSAAGDVVSWSPLPPSLVKY